MNGIQGAARSPNDAKEQQKLRQAAEDLRSATNYAASNALKKKLVKRLEVNLQEDLWPFGKVELVKKAWS